MNLLFTSFAVFAIYPDITRIKGVNGNEFTPRMIKIHHYVTLNDDKPSFGLFRNWDERQEGLSIRGIRPIVLHALNEWKRASLIQGRIDIPNSQFYWGPHGLVKRSVDDEKFHEEDNDDVDVQNVPRYSYGNGYNEEQHTEHTFEVVPTIILNADDYSAPYESYYIPCNYKPQHDSYDIFGTVKGNLQHWKNNPKYVPSKSETYRSSEARDPTLHSHGHSHFHQHVHSHGLNVLGPQTQIHSGAGLVHNAGVVTNVPISPVIPQTHITNINIPQQHSTGFTSHVNGGISSGLSHSQGLGGFSSHQTAVNSGLSNSHGLSGFSSQQTAVNSGLSHSQGLGGFSSQQTAVNSGLSHSQGLGGFSSQQTAVNSGLSHSQGLGGFSSHQTAVNSGLSHSHGLSGFSSHQTAVNIGHGGVGGLSGFGTSSTGGNVQIAQVSGANNAVSQSSFREAGDQSLGSPSIFQFPLNNRRVSFDRSSKREGNTQRIFQRRKRSLFSLGIVSKILKTVADDNNRLSYRPKRSLPLVKLAVDPNAKLDVFQTSDNMGKLIKNSLNDERSPVSHLKDMTGSLRDTFISSTRLIPSDVIVPARYKVIDTHQHDIVKIPLSRSSSEGKDGDSHFVGGINPAVYQQPTVSQLKSGTVGKEPQKASPLKNATLKKSKSLLLSKDPERFSTSSDPKSFYNTYQKIGDMIRNTVVSSQQTLSHVNDAISSGRKLAQSTKGAVPRLLVPLSKVPALEKPGSKTYVPVESDRVLLVAPKGSGVDNIVGSSRNHINDDFVSTSNLFDSVGLTHPTEDDENGMEYLLQRSTPQSQKKHLLLANNKGSYVDGALEVLNEAEETVDASNLHDFVVKLKNELERPHVVGEKNVIGAESPSKSCVCKKQRRTKGKTSEELLKKEETEGMNNKIRLDQEEDPEDPVVESSFVTRKDLLKPFMGRITLEDLHKILNDSRHRDEENEVKPKRDINREFRDRTKRSTDNNGGDDEPVLGAINPNLFEEYFNEPLQEIEDHHRDPFKAPADQITVSQQSRQSSNDPEHNKSKFLLKPFVTNGKSSEETLKILEKFGYETDARKKNIPKVYEIFSISS